VPPHAAAGAPRVGHGRTGAFRRRAHAARGSPARTATRAPWRPPRRRHPPCGPRVDPL